MLEHIQTSNRRHNLISATLYIEIHVTEINYRNLWDMGNVTSDYVRISWVPWQRQPIYDSENIFFLRCFRFTYNRRNSEYTCCIFSFRYRFHYSFPLCACITTFMRTLFNPNDLNLITSHKYIRNIRKTTVRMCRLWVNVGKQNNVLDSTNSHNYTMYASMHIDND